MAVIYVLGRKRAIYSNYTPQKQIISRFVNIMRVTKLNTYLLTYLLIYLLTYLLTYLGLLTYLEEGFVW